MDFNSNRLFKSCSEIWMDCSSLVFCHYDLRPGNILFNRIDGSMGIIDWETAEYIPREWIRSKFRCLTGMDLPEKKSGCADIL
jgi:hypothetical protein